MTSIGTGYDLTNSVFSPDGRIFQVEYAQKAVENGGTSIGIKCKDGVVLAVEKIITSKLLKPGANKRIQTIDKHTGITYSGILPDGRNFVNTGRDAAASYRRTFKEPIGVPSLVDQLASMVQLHTMHGSLRPFGVTCIVGGVDDDGPHLYMVEPNGSCWGYMGAATGKGRQSAKSELEKLDLPNITARQAVIEAARIIYTAHEDNKDKEFELEMTWVSTSETGGKHEEVPKDLLEEAIRLAQEADDEDEEMEE